MIGRYGRKRETEDFQESTNLVLTQKVIKIEKLEKSNTSLFQVKTNLCYKKGRYTTLYVVAVASEIYVL